MASRDLVGRPLVPFFDSDDNVNDSLQFGEGNDEREDMDVDARVWDKELGYFVYPSEQQGAASNPASIANRESRTDSGSKLLLTPSMMLSSSAPEQFNSMAATGNPVQATTDDSPTRSSSTKRGSKQKSRSNTPARRRKDKEGGEDTSAATTSSSKKGKAKGGNSNGNNSQQARNGKQKEQLSSSGKWAWSAFQSSPDPADLPMPPFLTKPMGNSSNGNNFPSVVKSPAPPLPPTPPPAEYGGVSIAPPLPPGLHPSQSPQPPLPPMPTAPPEVATQAQMSIELSMTQDLRRMLNIGGG